MEQRIREWAEAGVSTDVMTMVLRSEGALDADIAGCYDSLLQSGRYGIFLDRGISYWFINDEYL